MNEAKTKRPKTERSGRIPKAELQRRIRRHKRAALIVNTHSRKGGQLYPEAKRQLESHGFNLVASYAVKHPKRLNETISQALSRGPDLLIIGSGDGTLSEVVDHLAYTDTALGFIPLGTTNNFARSAGIPLDVAGAIDTIVNGQVDDIDLGIVASRDNDRDYFANVASIGLSVEVAASVPHKLKRKVGRLAYVLTGLRVLLSHRAFKARIIPHGTDGQPGMRRTIRTHQLVIANGRSHGGRVIARDVDIDNKQLTIFRLGRPGRWQLIKSLVRFSMHQNRSTTEKNYLTTPSASITTDPVCAVEIDGELKTHTPVTISVAPDALYVMTPRT